jgi:hypothetical protein
MWNFFLIKHHPRGLLGLDQENPRQKRDLPDTRTAPCPFSALAGRHDDGGLVSLTRCAVNTPNSAMQSEHVVRDGRCLKKPSDTFDEPRSAEIWVSHMPSLKTKELRKLSQEKSTPRTLKEVGQQYPDVL